VNRKKIINIIKIVLIVYALVGTALYFFQEQLLFHPVAIAADSTYHFQQPYKEQFIQLDEESKLHLVQFTVPDSLNKGVVLYFHGNKTNISRYAPFAQHFTRNHYNVWMVDYPGYGKSTGKLSEAILYEQALQLYKLARIKYQPNQIIIYGKSIGTGIAAQLASIRDCKKLILETPYEGLAKLIRRYLWMYPERMIQYQLPTYEYLKKVTAPVIILHGTNDGVIPYNSALQLKKQFKPGDEFITLENGEHNNLASFAAFQQKIDSLLIDN
jgi:pimeloyl-ACP methyl ester carboxylesterase